MWLENKEKGISVLGGMIEILKFEFVGETEEEFESHFKVWSRVYQRERDTALASGVSLDYLGFLQLPRRITYKRISSGKGYRFA